MTNNYFSIKFLIIFGTFGKSTTKLTSALNASPMVYMFCACDNLIGCPYVYTK